MGGEIYYPLFCAVDTTENVIDLIFILFMGECCLQRLYANATLQTINEVLQAAYNEEAEDARRCCLWVLVKQHDQQIFALPQKLITKMQTDFVGTPIKELGEFCKSHFANTASIHTEAFGVIDSQTLIDKSILFAHWEHYTAEDDAILDILWRETTEESEAWLQESDSRPEHKALIRKIQGKSTMADEVLLRSSKEAAVKTILQSLSRSTSFSARLQSRNCRVHPPPHIQTSAPATSTTAESKPSGNSLQSSTPHDTSIHSAESISDSYPVESESPKPEFREGWRTIRIPMTTAMRDTATIFRRSITDLMKVKSRFDENGILKY
jgi:hypothetical protein